MYHVYSTVPCTCDHAVSLTADTHIATYARNSAKDIDRYYATKHVDLYNKFIRVRSSLALRQL